MFSCTYLCVLREREKKNQSVIITSLYQRWYSVCLESTPAASHCAVVYSVKDRNYSLHILFCSSSKKCYPLNYYLLFFCNYIQDVWICCEYTAIKWCYPINCLDFLGPCSAGLWSNDVQWPRMKFVVQGSRSYWIKQKFFFQSIYTLCLALFGSYIT